MRRHAPLALGAALAIAACGGETTTSPPPPPVQAADTTPLRTYAAARGLFIGSAVDRGFRYAGSDGVQFRSVLAHQFDMLVPENDMKFDHLQPQQGTYVFVHADSLVAFAAANGMQVRGHTLVWHRQLPSWLTSGTWTPTQAESLLAAHVSTVVGHYRGQVREWDVVNEALADDGTLRPGFWADHIGADYIAQAFRAAHQADSTAILFYNDYGIEWPGAKADSAYALLARLRAQGVPVGGVGSQGHFQYAGGTPSADVLAANMARFAALGLQVHITELDVRVPVPSTADELQTQAQNYQSVVAACLRTAACNTIVTWGFTDRESWIPSTFSGWGDALLLDATYHPKPAFFAVRSTLKNGG